MSAYLKTPQGKRLILGPVTLVKWILFLGILTGYDIFYYIFWIVWIIESVLNIRELVLYRWRVPHFTLKTTLILLIILFVISNLLLRDITIIGYAILVNGIYIDRFISLSIPIIIGLLGFPVSVYKYLIIQRAKEKISTFNKLLVVGITGSYGKTSTKEFLSTLLSEKFKVAKTPEFTNTDIGIANYIVRELKQEHEIFVVEMGAYKKGEIKAICDMVKPKIGIITGINEQHLELFGSIENTMRTKFELIESLPKIGMAIINGNNDRCLEMAKWAEKLESKTVIYNITHDVKNIKTFTDHLEFALIRKNKNYLFSVSLLGKQAIENVLAAIYAAEKLGMGLEEIQKGVSKIVSPDKTMKLITLKKDLLLVDDTFNANPDGVVAALEYMKGYSGKKILVLTPLIELGDKAVTIHKKIARSAEEICDEIFLTNKNFSRVFTNRTHIINKDTFKDLSDLKHTLILFEGKEAARILKQSVIKN